jgi:hypothetical protein
MLADFKAAHSVYEDSYAIERAIGCKHLTEKLADRLAQYRQNRIIVIIGRGALLDLFV